MNFISISKRQCVAALFAGIAISTGGCGSTNGKQDFTASNYYEFDQVNKANVSKLKVAWTFHSGDIRGNVQLKPLTIKGIVYVTTPGSELIALDGVTGKEHWRFNPSRTGEQLGGINRGIAYWSEGDDERILYTSGEFLNAVNAKTGKAIESFGDHGRIRMNEGHIRPANEMRITSPGAPAVYKDLIILGGMTWDAPSNVSAYDVRTGKRRWIFHTIPQPREEGYESWGDSSFYKNGAGVNVWGGITVDEENELIYFGTGQPKDDFSRPANKGDQLYGNSVVALHATTGKKAWHYQYIHHDVWDLDIPCAPILTDLYKNGEKLPGLVQLTKTGNVFLFNRVTGELLSKVEERPVRGSTLPDEYISPTQPFVLWPEPFSKQLLTEADLTTLTPSAHAAALKKFLESDTGWMVPPSAKGIIYYGIHGGAEWGGGSYDKQSDHVYINANELAWNIVMRDVNNTTGPSDLKFHPGRAVYMKFGCVSCHGPEREGIGSTPRLTGLDERMSKVDILQLLQSGRRAMPAFSQIPTEEKQALADFLLGTESKKSVATSQSKKPLFRSLGYIKFLDSNDYPATKPPWGTLNAINIKTGKIDWKVPLGEYPELTAKGIPVTGTENFGGSIVTKGGLIFISATRDQKLRAFDKDSGKLLWETTLPFGGVATPSSYMVNGKQYIVIAATGGGKLGLKTGDAYVAFALP